MALISGFCRSFAGQTSTHRLQPVQSSGATCRTYFWPLYRFDPRRADEGKLPLALDSRPPSDALAETLLNEQRFRRLNAQQPEVAEQLWKDAAADLQKRYDFLAHLIVA